MLMFAVHISDGLLSWPWLVGGWMTALALIVVTTRKVPDAAIPALGVMTAAFFAGSQIHFRVLGLTTVHLLLNGIAGVRLGVLAIPAIAVGLLFQLVLFAHGGWTTLGLNITIYSLPALLAWRIFMLFQKGMLKMGSWRRGRAWGLGFIIGLVTAILTVSLNVLIITLGAGRALSELAPLIGAAHIPVIAIEAMMTGTMLAYMSKVEPQRDEANGTISSKGISH